MLGHYRNEAGVNVQSDGSVLTDERLSTFAALGLHFSIANTPKRVKMIALQNESLSPARFWKLHRPRCGEIYSAWSIAQEMDWTELEIFPVFFYSIFPGLFHDSFSCGKHAAFFSTRVRLFSINVQVGCVFAN